MSAVSSIRQVSCDEESLRTVRLISKSALRRLLGALRTASRRLLQTVLRLLILWGRRRQAGTARTRVRHNSTEEIAGAVTQRRRRSL